ncbi:MAG: hypothetical protein EAX81_02940 [Candidatus Thorarchaeota archaeon]|nr:hypothetical protein [Candidatus Thorarchaeota archaeon]
MNTIGLRKEEKAFETRVAVVPEHVKYLSSQHGIKFIIEPSAQRTFSEEEYKLAGANSAILKGSRIPIVLGIKEMPIDFFEKDIVYIFFSHTIKGQKQNMPMLKRILNTGATLIDYERILDSKGRRLIYFGNWAGIAGVSDTLRTLGQRMEKRGIRPNPFTGMKPTLQCKDLNELQDVFHSVKERIERNGLPESMTPFVVGFSGYGNVSQGAQRIFDILPHEQVPPDLLPNLPKSKDKLYKCIFKEEHLVEPKDPNAKFELQDYYEFGASKYNGIFHRYIPYLTVLMNCIYWSSKYPRLITKDFIQEHWNDDNRRLEAIGDISCDINGAIEITLQSTTPDNPAFSYIVSKDTTEPVVDGDGILVIAIDNLPCELPRESSTSFSKTLLDFIPSLAKADFTVPFDELQLPEEIKDAVIVYQGKLTKNYEYLQRHLSNEENQH